MSALDLNGIRKTFGALETLKGIDLSLEPGEFLVLLGSSGCGKSTLLNIIAGLSEATSGEIRIDGRVVNGVHPKDRDIAMVFQSYALYPNLTVARNVGFGLEMRGVAKAERDAAVAAVAKTLQIELLLARRPAELSGGQRQRVAIGRALVRNPKVFLFDEPLSNLDAKLRMEMRGELKALHQALGATIVYVTHDQIEAMTLATRIAVMRNGRIEQLGTPEEIYNKPATLYVAEFVGSPPMNLLRGTLNGSGLHLDGSDLRLPLPAGSASHTGPVILGLRPEALSLVGPADTMALDAVVELVELTGPELIVTARTGGQKVMASLSVQTKVRPHDRVRLGFSAQSLHLFDPKSEDRL